MLFGSKDNLGVTEEIEKIVNTRVSTIFSISSVTPLYIDSTVYKLNWPKNLSRAASIWMSVS